MSLFMRRGSSSLYPPTRIACFVCGSDVPADYPLFTEPPPGSPLNTPHFPFLRHQPPPLGCKSPEETNGVAKSCRVCYSMLMSQWDEYERGGVPPEKRIYWLKRNDAVVPQPPIPIKAVPVAAALDPTTAAVAAAAAVVEDPSVIMVAPGPAAPVAPSSVAAAGIVPPLSVTPTPPPSAAAAVAATPLASSSIRPPSRQPAVLPPPPPVIIDNDSALDLSSGSRDRETMKSRSSVTSNISNATTHYSSYQSDLGTGTTGSSATSNPENNLDLTLPDKNAATEVCYVCGDEFKKGLLSHTYAKLFGKEPFYPSLLCHPRPPKSRPMDSAGRVLTCDDCHAHLHLQWIQFESEDVPHADRNYTLRKRSNINTIDSTIFVCYICALDYHSACLRLLYARPNSENEPYYPFIEQQKPPPGASPISPQGMVQVCMVCYRSVKEKHHGFLKAEQPPPKKRRTNLRPLEEEVTDLLLPCSQGTLGTNSDNNENDLPADITCPLCRRKFSIGSFRHLHTHPPPAGGIPYFPFLEDLPIPEEERSHLIVEEGDKKGVRACQACTTSLINQWTAYQRDQVPIESRNYSYQSLPAPRRTSSRGSPCHAHSPRPRSNSNQFGSSAAAAATAAATIATSSTTTAATAAGTAAASSAVANATSNNEQQLPVRARSNTLESRPRSHSPRVNSSQQQHCHSPSYSVHSAASNVDPAPMKPSTSSFYCFLCGLHSEVSFSRVLYSTAPAKKAPYFPFMKTHVPKPRAETLREDGTALVCTFCYHSVMAQWAKHNERKPALEPSQRKYDIHDYSCFVCGIITYRKRIRALRVVDFPFLRHHKSRNKDVITLENGEMVAVCLDCFESLRGQFTEGAKYGIPVDKRQYNWMQIPPPPEEGASHITTPQERLQNVEHAPVS